jgi:hypothetical protein
MDKLLTYLSVLASVVPNFIGLLTHPKAQLKENIRPSEENWSRALVYFTVAMIFAGVVTIKAYNLPDIAWNICITFVVVILLAALTMLSWKLMRRPLDLAQSTLWCLYSAPTAMIIFIPFNIIAMGTLEPASRRASGAEYADFYQEHHIVYHSPTVLALYTLSFVLPIFDSVLPQLIERTRQSARRWRRGTTCSGLAIRR